MTGPSTVSYFGRTKKVQLLQVSGDLAGFPGGLRRVSQWVDCVGLWVTSTGTPPAIQYWGILTRLRHCSLSSTAFVAYLRGRLIGSPPLVCGFSSEWHTYMGNGGRGRKSPLPIEGALPPSNRRLLY